MYNGYMSGEKQCTKYIPTFAIVIASLYILIYIGCSRIYDPILKLYKQQTGKDSTKAIIFSERS